jgi:hypothetical protein
MPRRARCRAQYRARLLMDSLETITYASLATRRAQALVIGYRTLHLYDADDKKIVLQLATTPFRRWPSLRARRRHGANLMTRSRRRMMPRGQ